jgi:hypothetical protein
MRHSSLAFTLLFVVACSSTEPRRLGGTAGSGGGGAGSSGVAGSGGNAGATGTAGSGSAGATGTAGDGDAGATGTAGGGGAGATGTAGGGGAGATGTAGGGGAGATGTAGGGGAGATGTAGAGGAGSTGTGGDNLDAGAGDGRDADATVADGPGDTSSLDGNTADVPTTATIQINAGSTDAVAPFVVDTDFTGGTTIKHVNTIDLAGVTNPAPTAVYQTARTGTASYTIPGFTAGSTHLVRLHFAEIYWTMAAQRVFNVALNGTAVLTNFDVVATAGAANKAVIREYIQPASTTGTYVIQLTSVTDKALISGIEIY